jgi:hypoxanthine phosphoribosyltransferase
MRIVYLMRAFTKPTDYQPPEALQVLYGASDIAHTLERLAQEIHAALGKEFLMVGLLKGSFVFMADLVRALHHAGCSPQVDFMTISSYGAGKESSGTLTINREVTDELAGKPVLLVDDILESGRTLSYARDYLMGRGASSVHLCVLLDKPSRRVQPMEADFVGYAIADHFVVGYGLDYAGYYRELPFIGVLA